MHLHEDCELKVAFKLTQEQLDVQIETRQRLSPVTKLLSISTANAIKWTRENSLSTFKDWDTLYNRVKQSSD